MRLSAATLSRTNVKKSLNDDEDEFESLLKRCGEVYFTPNGLLLFHCTLCENDELTDARELCEHLTKNHQNVFYEKTNNHINKKDTEQQKVCESISQELANNSDVSLDGDEDQEFLLIKNETPKPDIDQFNIDDEFSSLLAYSITPAEESSTRELFNSDEEIIFDENDEEFSQNTDITQIEDKQYEANENEVETAETEKTVENLLIYETSKNNTVAANRAGPRIKDPLGERRYKCTLCGLAFKEGFNLSQHLRRHNQAKRFKCTQCTKSFHTRTELNTHFRRHTGETPFMCAECGRQFVTSGALTQHTRRHLNYRPYECDICPKRFFDTSQLKHHYIVHTRERMHTCSTCQATFARRKALITHMKIHANKREYKCTICQSAFNQAPGLRMHMRNKHKDIIAVQETLKKKYNN